MNDAKPLAAEMVKQIRLGHAQFCVGAHEHEGGELEYEWIDWDDALDNLLATARASSGRRCEFCGSTKHTLTYCLANGAQAFRAELAAKSGGR